MGSVQTIVEQWDVKADKTLGRNFGGQRKPGVGSADTNSNNKKHQQKGCKVCCISSAVVIAELVAERGAEILWTQEIMESSQTNSVLVILGRTTCSDWNSMLMPDKRKTTRGKDHNCREKIQGEMGGKGEPRVGWFGTILTQWRWVWCNSSCFDGQNFSFCGSGV